MATLALQWPRTHALSSTKLGGWTLGAFIIIFGVIRQFRPALDPDLNWHLRTGQLILATGAIPRVDSFSHTMAGAPWVDFEWLYEAALATIYGLGGAAAIITANAILSGVTGWLVYSTLRTKQVSPILAALGVGLSIVDLVPYADVRPNMMGALLVAAFLYVLECAWARRSWRRLLWLLPLQLLWVNVHGSFIQGLALCGLYGLAALWERLSGDAGPFATVPLKQLALGFAGLMSALAAICLANPQGLGLVRFVIGASQLKVNHDFNGEWAAPNFHAAYALPLLATVLLTIVLSICFSRGRLAKREALLLVAAVAAALTSNQFGPFYAVAAAPLAASMLARVIQRPLDLRPSLLHGALFGAVLLGMVGISARSLQPAAYQDALANAYPVQAVQYIEQHNLQGPLWNEFNWGSYLLGALPRLPVFIDGRTEMYGDAFFKQYRDVEEGAVRPEPTLDTWNINVVLIPVKSPLATVLREGAAWNEVYDDDQAAIFTRA